MWHYIYGFDSGKTQSHGFNLRSPRKSGDRLFTGDFSVGECDRISRRLSWGEVRSPFHR
ncbi:hypothetical protein [Arthrospira sp. PCC 8006]|uniref:hypothetical protein n=1 Tax=Oscillatoriales TaxID=1150 RepID=UPI00396F2EA9